MIKIFIFLFFSLFITFSISAKTVIKGPYTVKVITENVFNIEDSNESNRAGMIIGDDGQVTHMNNCSDMYLIRGKDKSLLIDLSNEVKWDGSAKETLRSIVYDIIENGELYITVTHKHGDHLGMLPAFRDDSRVKFWIPKEEFKDMVIFPKDRTEYFPVNSSFDLGDGAFIDSMEVPGHTDHSTIFFLKGKNIVFTGDAIGSGSGVWLFNRESFYTYVKSIEELINYLKNPASRIDPEKLVIYGGHGWQRGRMEKLTMQYLYDMESLIERMGLGIAESEKMSVMVPFIDTNFKYRSATISWNKDAAAEYADSMRKEMGTFTRISKHKDYSLTVTRLVVDLGEGSGISEKDLTKDSFEVTGLNKSNKVIRNITGLSVTDKNGDIIESGSHVTVDLDFGFDADPSNAYSYIVELKKDLGKYKTGKRFIRHGRILRK